MRSEVDIINIINVMHKQTTADDKMTADDDDDDFYKN